MNNFETYLAKLGIVISTDENNRSAVQRIDSPKEFEGENDLKFTPPLLKDDEEALDIYLAIPLQKLEEVYYS